MPRADGARKSSKPLGINYEAFFTVHSPDYTTLVRKKKEIICLKLTNRYKKDKTFRSLTAHQSYIATFASDSSYVQTTLLCVKTRMTECSSDSLANSLPRPSKCSCAEAGQGSRSASTGLVFSPRGCNRLHEISARDTIRCRSSTVQWNLQRFLVKYCHAAS